MSELSIDEIRAICDQIDESISRRHCEQFFIFTEEELVEFVRRVNGDES